MKLIYKCDICGKEFNSKHDCFICECSHIENENERIKQVIIYNEKDPCDYCNRSYYAYGCERNCEYEKLCKTYEQFVPVEPLHNKSITGV